MKIKLLYQAYKTKFYRAQNVLTYYKIIKSSKYIQKKIYFQMVLFSLNKNT